MQVKLSQILSSLESGGRPKGGASLDNNGIPSLGAEHLDSNGGFNFKSIKYIPEDYFNGLKNGIIEKENILIVKDGATTGKVSFVTEDFPFEKASVNEHVFLLKIDKTKAYPKFAFHYLKCPQGQRDIMRDFRGATVGGISRGFVDFVKFELPPLPDQLHIANLLSKAENLIAQRKESIHLLDEFLKSTFLEMFGDPVRNEKRWEINSLSKFGSLKNGLNYTRSESGVSVRCLGVGDFKDFSKLTEMESLQILNLTTEPNNEYFLKDGDLLFVRSNGNRELVGRCLLVFPKSAKVTFSGFCIRYRIENDGLNPIFISHLFRVPIYRTSMLQGGKGANIQNISQQTLQKLRIPTPPIELQTQFAQIVEKTEALKTQYQQSLQELENLYGSFSQKAFRGCNY
jgi:type I restriction enzyme S subunit